jgi:protein TonB
MKTIGIIMMIIFSSCFAKSQEIVNLALVGDNGVTENIKEAHSFILIKKYPDGTFQRLNYKLYGPLKNLQTYSDSTISIKEGNFYSYTSAGQLELWGWYSNNKKDKEWTYYNDKFKAVRKETYENGILIKSVDYDTVKDKHTDTLAKDESEAVFVGGQKAWVKFLVKNLDADLAAKSVKGGEVNVCFIVSKTGKISSSFLQKSVEFILDEEALRVINLSPDWKPAVQAGKNVNAYRVQPITFSVPE